MFFDFIHDKEQRKQRIAMRDEIDKKIYLKAYCELVTYIQQLFSYYNSEIKDDDLEELGLIAAEEPKRVTAAELKDAIVSWVTPILSYDMPDNTKVLAFMIFT